MKSIWWALSAFCGLSDPLNAARYLEIEVITPKQALEAKPGDAWFATRAVYKTAKFVLSLPEHFPQDFNFLEELDAVVSISYNFVSFSVDQGDPFAGAFYFDPVIHSDRDFFKEFRYPPSNFRFEYTDGLVVRAFSGRLKYASIRSF